MAQTKVKSELIDGGLGTDWQSAIKTSNFTAEAGKGYFVNTTSGTITITLPSSPSIGDEVSIVDYTGTFATNSVTLTSSNNIKGASADVLLSSARQGTSLVYSDATQGWISYNSANQGNKALSPTLYDISYLLVAGGGGGAGFGQAGGGGAGGLLTGNLNSISDTLNIVIGAGGTGGPAGAQSDSSKGGNGGLSSISGTGFTTLTAIGGGYGHSHGFNGGAGGSGGGGGTQNGSGGQGGAGTAGQGNNGGTSGTYASPYCGSGGGGAGAAGTAGGNQSGNGGIGVTTTIISTANAQASAVGQISGGNLYFAGGGGGGCYLGTSGAGGLGGGGTPPNGTQTNGTNGSATNSAANTGGGGAGSAGWHSSNTGGAGGSGVCILKIPSASYSATTSGSPDVYTEGSFKILVFKQSGSYTA